MCLHGLLLRHGVEDRTVLCLGHRTWATFTWPLKELRDNVWVLNQSADVGASFIFTYNPDEWQAVWPNVFLEEGVGITLTPQGCFEQLPMAALRASTKMTFEHLSIIGKCLGIHKAQSLPRRDLIGRCCDIVSESIDGSFREFILDLEDQHVSKRKLPVSNPELAQHFLDGLDKDELEVQICSLVCFVFLLVCVCLCLSPHLAFLVACHHCSGKEAAKKKKAVAKAFAKAKGKGHGRGRGQRRGRGRGQSHGKGKGKSRNAQVPAQVQDSEVEESELGDGNAVARWILAC